MERKLIKKELFPVLGRVLICAVILETIKLCIQWPERRILFWKITSDLNQGPIYRLAGLILVIFASVAASHIIYERSKLRRKIGWWSSLKVESGETLDWTEAFNLGSLDWMDDPAYIADVDPIPGGRNSQIFDAALLLIAGCVGATAMDYVFFPHIPTFLLPPPYSEASPSLLALIQVSNNLTAYLAILTALIAVYVARFTIRAQVRSKSRQEWIDKVRSLVAELISDIDLLFKNEDVNITIINKRRIRLELLLNPSEKDHRLLTMLLRVCTHPGLPVLADQNLRKLWKEQNISCYINQGSQSLLSILNKGEVEYKKQSEAISYVIKLSNIVLKREWERVRQTR